MNLELLTIFFRWCTLFAGGIYIFSVVVVLLLPDFISKMHGRLFKITPATIHTAVYAYLALYKVIFIIFVFVPYLALSIMI